MHTITSDDMRYHVVRALGNDVDQYDVKGIVSDLIATFGRIDLADTRDGAAVSDAVFWSVVHRHDLGAPPIYWVPTAPVCYRCGDQIVSAVRGAVAMFDHASGRADHGVTVASWLPAGR